MDSSRGKVELVSDHNFTFGKAAIAERLKADMRLVLFDGKEYKVVDVGRTSKHKEMKRLWFDKDFSSYFGWYGDDGVLKNWQSWDETYVDSEDQFFAIIPKDFVFDIDTFLVDRLNYKSKEDIKAEKILEAEKRMLPVVNAIEAKDVKVEKFLLVSANLKDDVLAERLGRVVLDIIERLRTSNKTECITINRNYDMYKLFMFTDMRYADLCKAYGLSRSRVPQIINKIHRQFRHPSKLKYYKHLIKAE